MATFVTSEWVESHLDSPEILVIDPRRPTKYLQGHLRNAVNLPLAKVLDQDVRLRSVDDLAAVLGGVGLDARRSPLLYDAADGRYAAMLAWLLEYLGRTDVRVMDVFLERWVAEGRTLFYRPVKPVPAAFTARVVPQLRATLEDVRGGRAGKLTDFRSCDEYTGRLGPSAAAAGHIPGAVNLDWQALAGEEQRFLGPRETLQRLVDAAGITREDRVVAYCQTGPRAAIGYLALRSLGLDVRLFDGSFAEWIREGLPVEAPKK